MNTTLDLTAKEQRTYDRIFQHPISHNLEWREVHTLLGRLGHLEDQHDGRVRVTRNGQMMVLSRPHHKDISEMHELMEIRHFIEKSNLPDPQAVGSTDHWLLVIDHQEARLFSSDAAGSVPQRILPHDPAEYFRQAHLAVCFSRGLAKPDPESYFEPIAKALGSSGDILLFGNGVGMSSEIEQFVNWAKRHHPALVKRIVGSVAIDEQHLTEPQILAKAREFFSARAVGGK